MHFPNTVILPKTQNTFVKKVETFFWKVTFFNYTWPMPFVFTASLPCVLDC